ncbi:hypothetical protein C8F01DRAFT_1136999 [Mycena amicta]|nr:hypothetical protein C8F01DRAFT_1136999 [Mycena amicta]
MPIIVRQGLEPSSDLEPEPSSSRVSISAGVTAGATIGGVLLVAVAVAGVFVYVRRRGQRPQPQPRQRQRESRGSKSLKRSDTIVSFSSRGDLDEERGEVDGLLEKTAHFRSESESSRAPLLYDPHTHQRTDSESSTGTPSRPRIGIEIPPSPGLPQSTAFRATLPPSHDHDYSLSAVSSACMSSASPAPSPHSAFALSAFAGAGAGAGTMPIRTVQAAHNVVAQRAQRQLTTSDDNHNDRHRASVHPLALQRLPGGPSTAALMDLPFPFVFQSQSQSTSTATSTAQYDAIDDLDLDDSNSPLPELGTTTLDAAQLSEVIAAAKWEWPDAPGARATMAAMGNGNRRSGGGVRPMGPRRPSYIARASAEESESQSGEGEGVQPLQVRRPKQPESVPEADST